MRSLRTTLGTVCVVSCLAAPGCRKATEQGPATAPTPETSVTEQGDNGTIQWDVRTDGQVRAVVKGKDGQAITKDIKGTLTYPGYVGDQMRDVSVDEKGFLVAAGPALEDDLTEIDYALVVGGEDWNGVLHVPIGGTQAIQDDARKASLFNVPAGKTGPNGGAITYVGEQPVEVVADKDSGQIRVYTLGRDYTVTDPGDRTFRLGYAADYPGMEVLVREPGATYYVGPWYAGYDPFRVTVAMSYGGVTSVGVVGYHFGESFRVGVGFPGVVVVGSYGWGPSMAVRAGVGFGVGFGFGVGCSAGFGMAYGVRAGVAIGGGVGMRGGVAVGGRGGVAVGGRGGVDGRMGGRGGDFDRDGRDRDGRDREGRDRDGRDHEGRDHEGRDRDGRDRDGRDRDGRDRDGRDRDGRDHGNEHSNVHDNEHSNVHNNVHDNVHNNVHGGSSGGRSGGFRSGGSAGKHR